MALNDVLTVLEKITKVLTSGLTGASSTLTWLGITLIAIVIGYYIVLGLVKAAKAFLNMKVKYLSIFALLLGIIFIAVALVLP